MKLIFSKGVYQKAERILFCILKLLNGLPRECCAYTLLCFLASSTASKSLSLCGELQCVRASRASLWYRSLCTHYPYSVDKGLHCGTCSSSHTHARNNGETRMPMNCIGLDRLEVASKNIQCWMTVFVAADLKGAGREVLSGYSWQSPATRRIVMHRRAYGGYVTI